MKIERLLAKRRRKVLQIAPRPRVHYVTKPEDVSYLTGFTGEDSAALLAPDWSMLITDFRFQEQAPVECPGVEIRIRSPKRSLAQELALVANERRVRSISIQEDHMTVGELRTIRKKLEKARTRVKPIKDVIGRARLVKDEEEIRLTRRAVDVAEKAFRKLMGRGARYFVGRSERQLAAELEFNMRELGAEGPSFELIVATGPNGSMCHYRPGNRKVKRGDPVLFDWGALVDGYMSDTTRVVFVGPPTEKLREIYALVLAAHDAGVAAIRSGAKCAAVDRVARDIIAAAGYGNEFGHSLGHGIGREIHEYPRLSRFHKDSLRKNMIVTVEPGIYLPGIGGVRIEDDILVTAKGGERLNRLPRKLERMVLR